MSNSQFYKRGGVPEGFVNLGAPGVYGPSSTNFNLANPFAPTTDPHGPFGSIPKDVPMPNPFGDLSKIYPGLGAANAAAGANIASQMAGQLSPATQAAIQDASAQFGVSSGMPGSGLQRSRTVRDLGLSTEAIQDQGLKNYLAALGVISNTQTVNPALQTEINTQNTLNRSAPDPTAAAAYSKTLFDQYLANMRGPGGGTGNRSSYSPFQFTPNTSTSSFTPPTGPSGFPNPTPMTGGSTAMTPQIPGFTPPENWSLFSPKQQWGYGDQLNWAKQFGNIYE